MEDYAVIEAACPPSPPFSSQDPIVSILGNRLYDIKALLHRTGVSALPGDNLKPPGMKV